MVNLKRLIACILTLLLAPCGIFAASAGDDVDIDMGETGTSTFTVSQMEGSYKTQGRTSIISGELSLDYTASSFEFNADCEGDVYVDFGVSNISTNDGGGLYISIFVDGVKQDRDAGFLDTAGVNRVKIASNLEKGEHSFKVFRSTEIERGRLTVKSVTLNGKLLEKPDDKDLFIEFIGASSTTGYGNLTTGRPTPSAEKPIWQDGTATYAFLTAQQLDADISVVARQGIGAYTGWQPVSMDVVYPLTRHAWDANTQWSFERLPDIVVIQLGSNDMTRYQANGKTLGEVKQGFKDFLELVRTKNPDAPIVWLYGITANDPDEMIRQVITEAGGAEAGYYTVEVPTNTNGGNNHPDLKGHEDVANVLTRFLNTEILKNEPSYTPGDINGDGKVDDTDVMVLARYLAQWDMNEDEYVVDAMNTNGDSSVDDNDVAHLRRYLARWDGIELR